MSETRAAGVNRLEIEENRNMVYLERDSVKMSCPFRENRYERCGSLAMTYKIEEIG